MTPYVTWTVTLTTPRGEEILHALRPGHTRPNPRSDEVEARAYCGAQTLYTLPGSIETRRCLNCCMAVGVEPGHGPVIGLVVDGEAAA